MKIEGIEVVVGIEKEEGGREKWRMSQSRVWSNISIRDEEEEKKILPPRRVSLRKLLYRVKVIFQGKYYTPSSSSDFNAFVP